MRLREFAPAGGGADGNYFRELASAWYNGTFDSGSLQKGIKSQQDVERLLQRGVIAKDLKMRKYHIDYNGDFDGVEIFSDDYYEYGDHDATIDSRTGEKWGPYDFMEFSDEQLDESLNELAPPSGNNGDDEMAILKYYAGLWWNGNDATRQYVEKTLAKMGWEIGEDEGGYDNGGVFVVQPGDENGDSYESWPAEDLTEGVAEGSLEEVDRRGFLKGLGAAAVAGAAGMIPTGAKAEYSSYSLQSGDGQWLVGAMALIYFGMYGKVRNRGYVAMAQSVLNDLKKVAAPVLDFIDNVYIMDTFEKMRDSKPDQYKMYLQASQDSDVPITILNKVLRIKDNFIRGMSPELQRQYANELGHTIGMRESVSQGVAEEGYGVDPNNPFGPQGRFVGDTGPAQITTTVPRHEFRAGDRVIYRPTGARARIENLYKNGTVARIHVASGMGGQYFDAKVADLRPIGQGRLEEKSTSQAQFRTMAAAAHDPEFARKVGIKQSVAREFNKADRGQSYKSLPKKAD